MYRFEEVAPRADYVVIDVEGHELKVIEGMNLEKNYKNYPMLQIEVGGTWVDPTRSAMSMFQSEFVDMMISDLGYKVFLMGEKSNEPVYLPLTKQMVRDSCQYKGNSKCPLCYLDGNLLAIHPSHVRKDIVSHVYENIKNGLNIREAKLRYQKANQ